MSSNKIEEFLAPKIAETHENQVLVKRVRKNVVVMRYSIANGTCWSLRVYDTEVIQYLPGELVQLTSNGHRTKMTKSNLNQFMPEGWGVTVAAKHWFLLGPNSEDKINAYPFVDGMLFDPNAREVFYPSRLNHDNYLPYRMVPLAYHRVT